MTERLLALTPAPGADEPTADLIPREHDCIAYIARGKSDWEISMLLGVLNLPLFYSVMPEGW